MLNLKRIQLVQSCMERDSKMAYMVDQMYYVVAGNDKDNPVECKIFVDYIDASNYRDILMEKSVYNYVGIKKHTILNDESVFTEVVTSYSKGRNNGRY